MTTNINTETLDAILKEHLIGEVKKHLQSLIENDLETLARDAVVRFMDIEIAKSGDPMAMNDNYYFQFVKKITKTVQKTVVVKEKV